MGGLLLRVSAVAVALFTLAAGPPATPLQAPQERPVFRTGANVVRVDVTVTNTRGEPASDLTRDDFALTEDGAPQTIDSFELVHVTGQPTDDRALEIHSASQAVAEAARDDVRLFLIFWDEYHIGQFLPATRGREILTEFVRTAFWPTDLVGIMDQLTTVESIKFTRDRLQLVEQVHELRGRLGILVPPRSAVEEAHLQYPREIGRLRNEVTTSALNAAAAFLGNVREGRKALLFVSQGIPVYGRDSETAQYMDIVRTANTNNTAIYTLDPASEVGRRAESLVSLAADTGGRPFLGTNRPALMLPQIVRDASAYYLLGYKSPAPVDGKFHRIKVRLNKDGYEVRARSGYFAPSVGDMERGRAAAAAAELPPDVERALGELSQTERSDHRIGYWVGMARGEGGRTRVTIAWAPTAQATESGAIVVGIDAKAPDGTSYVTTGPAVTREVSFEAPAGELVLVTKALNSRGEEIEGDMRRLTVLSFDSARLAIGSPRLIRTRTAREARSAIEGADAPAEVGREFDRSDRLFIRFPVYGGTQAAAKGRLLNSRGKELSALSVARLHDGVYQMDLPLSVTPRGDYLIAIEATLETESVRALLPIRVR